MAAPQFSVPGQSGSEDAGKTFDTPKAVGRPASAPGDRGPVQDDADPEPVHRGQAHAARLSLGPDSGFSALSTI